MTQPTLVCVCMDVSGSMQPLQRASIDGFNEFLRDQQEQEGDCRFSLTLFNTSFDIRHLATPVAKVDMLNTYTYQPNGGTALLDAVGSTIKGTEQWLESQKQPAYDRTYTRLPAWKVVVAVLTDGYENSSQQWHINQPPAFGDDRDLLGLIKWKQNEGWEFVFLGAGGSDWLEKTFGSVVAHDHFVAYAHTGAATMDTYAGVSNTVSTLRSTGDLDTSTLHIKQK
jgi:hypothetical protein